MNCFKKSDEISRVCKDERYDISECNNRKNKAKGAKILLDDKNYMPIILKKNLL